jgi:ParB-like chromosome segregation protein Spo0J
MDDEREGKERARMITHCRIEEIKVGPRFRKRLGNLEALARSIESVGSLHPIVIDQHFNLVAGRRRLEALRLLIEKGADGYKQVPVRQVNLDDLLAAEHDENVQRLDFAPSEAVAVAEALEARLREQAKARQLAGLRQGQESPVPPTWRDGELGEVRERLATRVGMGRTNLGKARAVVEAARRDPALYGDLVERMDETRLVDPAFKELKRRAEDKVGQHAQQAMLSQPGPDDPYPTIEDRAYRDIRGCSAEELLASLDHCVDAIVTEPRAFHAGGGAARRKMYADLARLSRQALKQNGALAIISRDSADNFSDLMAAVTPHLPYRAMIAIQMAQYSKPAGWWPVVVFSAGSPIAFSAGSGHPIQPRMAIRPYENDEGQGIGDLIELLTKPLQLVADPFMGDSTGIVQIGRSRFQPVEYACLHLDRNFVGADPDGLFGYQGPSRLDLDRLWQMLWELNGAEPPEKHLIKDEYGKVTGGLAKPSSYPALMGQSKSHRTRQHADRLIRLIEMYLNGIPAFTGKGLCPPGFAKISREDMALLHWALDLASEPLDEAVLAELLNGGEEAAPDGRTDAPPDWVTESYLEQPDQDHGREQDQEDRVPFE